MALSTILNDIKNHLGLVLVAEAGHGKSFTAFSLVKQAMQDSNMTIIVISPSSLWRRNYGSINCVKVGTTAFNPIVKNEETKVRICTFS